MLRHPEGFYEHIDYEIIININKTQKKSNDTKTVLGLQKKDMGLE